jgi:hypothetical protein
MQIFHSFSLKLHLLLKKLIPGLAVLLKLPAVKHEKLNVIGDIYHGASIRCQLDHVHVPLLTVQAVLHLGHQV